MKHNALKSLVFILLACLPATVALGAVPPAAKEAPAGFATVPESERVPLSLNSVILFALADNPDVQMALSREQQAGANKKQAASGFYPLINVAVNAGGQYNRPFPGGDGRGARNRMTSEDVSLRQTLFDFNQTRNNFRSKQQLENSAKLDTEGNVEDVLDKTIQSYLQILRYQKVVKNDEVFVERIRALLKTVEDMFEAGGASKATLNYAQSRLAAAETTLNTSRAALNDAMSTLESLTGDLPDFNAQTPDDLDPARIDLDDYVAYAGNNNTGMMMAQSDMRAQEYKLDAAKKAAMPTFAMLLTGNDSMNDGGQIGRQRKGAALLQMNYKLFDGYATKSQEELASAQLTEMRIGLEKTRRELVKNVKLAYNQLQSLEAEKRHTDAEVKSSEALQELNRVNFKLGSISIIELIEGEERLNGARDRLHGQESDIYVNTYKLLIATGHLKKAYFCKTCGGGDAG